MLRFRDNNHAELQNAWSVHMDRLTTLGFAIVAALSIAQPAFAREMEPGDVAAVARAAPAVVSIATWQEIAPAEPGGPSRRIKIYGSGFIIDPSGIIVTNKHVITGAFDAKATLTDGTTLPARLIAASPLLDVAVLKVDAGHPLPSVEWGSSDALQVGDPVLTIGNALDWPTSVSAGIVSGLNRNLMDTPFDSYIQTDATINHGNSGGPLVNQEGKVVGIDTALFNPVGNGFIGIGFAIPASAAQYVTTQLLDPKYTPPGWLGFKLQDMTWGLGESLGVPYHVGAIVSSIDPSGPAAKASLQWGDVLEQFNGHRLNDSRAFMRAIAETPVGKPVRLTIYRGDKKQEVDATVAPWPDEMHGGIVTGQAAAEMMTMIPHPGMEIAPITEADRKQYGLDPALKGVLISQVRPDSQASYLGVTAGNVIIAVDRNPVATPEDVQKAIKEAHEQDRGYLALLIQTKSGAHWVSLSISAKKS
jgi:serine protease Do